MASYTATLIADGYDDVQIPISSISLRLRQSPLQCYVNVVVPKILDYITAIGQRVDGEIRLDEDGSEIITANIYELRYDIGASKRSGSITAYKQITFTPTQISYSGSPIYKRITSEGTTYRTLPDITFKPGYYCSIGAENFYIDYVTWTVNATNRLMEFNTTAIPVVTLAPEDGTHAQTAETTTVAQTSYLITLADAAQAQTMDAPSLVQANVLTVADITQAQELGFIAGFNDDIYFINVLLYLHMDGTNGSTTFTDDSLYDHTVTPSNVTLTTSISKEGTASGDFTNSAGYLSVADHDDFDFSTTEDFTWEAWVYPTDISANLSNGIISYCATTLTSPRLIINNLGELIFYTASNVIESIDTVEENTWQHVAVTRSSGTLRVFLNGVASAGQFNSEAGACPSGPQIGREWNTGNNFQGYIDEVRLTIGTARYTGNFMPDDTLQVRDMTHAIEHETQTWGADPDWANVLLQLHMDGTNGSTTFTDDSSYGHTTTATNLTITTSESKFGGASGDFTDSNSYLSITDHADFDIASNEDFTWEAWIYPTTLATTGSLALRGIVSYCETSYSQSSALVINNGAILSFVGNGVFRGSSSGLTVNTWQHVAVVRASGVITTYIDGTGTTGNTWTDATTAPAGPQLGRWYAYLGNTTGKFLGYMDDVRITIGTARYTEDFTPPGQAFPDG